MYAGLLYICIRNSDIDTEQIVVCISKNKMMFHISQGAIKQVQVVNQTVNKLATALTYRTATPPRYEGLTLCVLFMQYLAISRK